jgi:dipeptidyl aminopeptidase/acylaminoacyl peptidase
MKCTMSTPRFRVLALLATATLAAAITGAGILAVVIATAEPAEAAFPGENGKIAFPRWDGISDDIWVMNADGTDQANLTNHTGGSDYAPSFSADGKKIAFTSNRDGNEEIYVMNADGSDQSNLTNDSDGYDTDPSFSPDSSKIAFSRDNTEDIYVMNSDGTEQTNLTSALETDGGLEGATHPAFSSDGKIAFTRFGTCPDGDVSVEQIWSMKSDGTGLENLSGDSCGRDTYPTFSPDGMKIAFMRRGRDLWVMNADGTGQSFLTSGDFGAAPAFSPDGTKIAYTNGGIHIINANGSETPTKVPNTTDTGGGIDWGVAPGTAGCTIVGTAGKDVLNGTAGDDVICGLGANDTIYGLGGNDTIYGGTGEDTLVGGPGADKLYGERSNDTLDSRDGMKGNDKNNGGVGTDTCLRDQRDTGNSCEKG